MNHRLRVILACCVLGCSLGIWRVDAAWGDDLDRCISAAKKTNLSCWNKCDASEDDCIADCDADFEARKQQCRSSARANTSGNTNGSTNVGQTDLSGTTKTGQGGCYYGECPPDLDKRIEDSADEEEPPQRKPQRRQQPKEEPTERSSFPPAAQAQMTRICQTPTFWCTMFVVGPVNSPCWCASAFGPANGITIPER